MSKNNKRAKAPPPDDDDRVASSEKAVGRGGGGAQSELDGTVSKRVPNPTSRKIKGGNVRSKGKNRRPVDAERTAEITPLKSEVPRSMGLQGQ